MLKIKNQKRDPAVPAISMYGLFNLSSTKHWDDVVVDEKALHFTRREMRRDIRILAKAMLELGVKKGDIVMVATGRSMYANVVIFFACNRIGAICSFHDERSAKDTILHYLEEFKSPLLFTYRKTPGRVRDLKREAPKTLKNIVNMTAGSDEKEFKRTIIETFMLGKTPLTKIAAKFTGRVPSGLMGADREALISFTSGSTSGPKPMVFTNRNLIASAIYSKVASGVKMWDKELHTWMSYVRFDCPYGLVVSVLAPICGGGEVILTPDISDDNLVYYLAKNPNTIFGIPPLLEILPKILPDDVDISGLKMFASGGERLEKEASLKARDFFKARHMDVKISNGYGVGEALGLISTAVGNAAYNPDSVGHIPAGAHVMILDSETGEELGFGKTGILYVTGKHILNRYYHRPELDEEKIVMVKGRKFVKTGDLAYVTENGYVTLVGRASFFINNLPAKVYYEVVRAAIAKSDLVKKCYVVKGPDKKLKLAAYAFVVTNDGVGHNNQVRREIIKKATEPFNLGKRRITLKQYEIPRKVIFLDDLPITRANKTDFRKLEKMAKELGEKEMAEPAKTSTKQHEAATKRSQKKASYRIRQIAR